jgi:hypothetical protein
MKVKNNNSNKKKSKKGGTATGNPPAGVAVNRSGDTTTRDVGSNAEASIPAVPIPPSPVALLPKVIQVQWEAAMGLKVLGNESFRKKEYQAAIEYYTKGIDLCSSSSSGSSAAESNRSRNGSHEESTASATKVLAEMELQLRANRAQVYLKLGQGTKAEADCTAIIDYHLSAACVTPLTTTVPYKVWYRRALARESLVQELLHQAEVTSSCTNDHHSTTIAACTVHDVTRYLGGAKRDLQEERRTRKWPIRARPLWRRRCACKNWPLCSTIPTW